MSRNVPPVLTLALTLLAVGPLAAQRVRLWAPKPTIGTLVRSDSAVFVLARAAGDTVTVARRAVGRAEVSRGSHSATLSGAALGVTVGGFVCGVLGAAAYRKPTCDPPDSPFCWDFGIGTNILVGAAFGAVVAGGLGALIGSQTRVDDWATARHLVGVRMTAAPRSVGVQVGLRF